MMCITMVPVLRATVVLIRPFLKWRPRSTVWKILRLLMVGLVRVLLLVKLSVVLRAMSALLSSYVPRRLLICVDVFGRWFL